MGKLVFRVASDWQEVVRLRTEIEKLKQTLLSMDSTQSPNTFKKLNVQLGESTKKMNILISEAAKTGATMENDFKKGIYDGEKAVNSLSEEIIKQKNIIRETQNDVSMLTEQYKKLGKYDPKRQSLSDELNRAKAALGEQKYALGELQSQQALARLSTKALKDEYALFKDESKAVINVNEGVGVSFKKTLAAIGGIAMLKQVASNVVSTAGMFQKYESVLTNALNGSSEKAKAYLSDINSFAAKTNFQLDELTDDFIKFVNRGVTPSMDAMKKMGDFTNTVAKPFDQLTEAILDINNSERWKEFGVRVQTEGDKVKLSFRDMTVECDRTVESVMKAVEQFGSMKGVEGSTEAISKTIEGQMSNLEDTITTALAEIGLANQGLISGSISAVDTIVKNYDIIGKSVLALIEIYGVYRTGLLINTIVEQGSVKSIWAKITATKAATIAQAAYNKVLAMNPYVAVGMAVVSLGIAVYTLADHTTYAEKTARTAAESMEQMKNASESLKNKISELLSVIRDETSTQYQKADAYLKLQGILPEVFKNMDIEKIKLMDQLSLLKQINKAADRREIVGAKTSVVLAQKEVDKINALIAADSKRGTYSGQYEIQLSDAKSKLEAAKKVVVDIEKIQTEANKQKEKDDKKVVIKNKEFWSNQKKEAEMALDAIASSQKKLMDAGNFKGIDDAIVESYKDNIQKLKEAEKELKVYVPSSKQENETKRLREQQEKISELERKQSLERQRRIIDLENQAEQAKIDTLADGYEKEKAQRDLNNKMELETLERQKEDYIQKVVDMQRQIFEAEENAKATKDKSYQKKTFDASSVSVDTSMFNKMEQDIKKKQINETAKYYNDVLSKYQDYVTKRLNAEKQFNADREKLEKSGASDTQLKELEYQRNETYNSIDKEFAMREDSFQSWADGVANLSLKKLNELLVQAERELERMEFVTPNNPKLAEQRAKVITLKNTISDKQNKTQTTPDKRSNKEWQELYKTLSEVENQFNEIGDAVGGTAGDIISSAGQITTSTLQMINGIVSFGEISADNIQGVSAATAQAIASVEKASVILAIIGAALQIASKIASLFKRTDYMEEFRKEMEKLNYELELAKLNAEISAEENNIFGDDLWKNAIKNVELANEAFMKYNNTLDKISNRKIFPDLGKMFGISGIKNTFNSLEKSIANMQIQVQHKTFFRSAKYKSLKDAVPELFNDDGSVNMDALEKFIGSDTFKKLSGENQKYLQEMSDYWKSYQEAVEQVKDYLTDIFGDLGNTMSDALVDAFANGTDAAKVFTDSVSNMLETLAKQMIYSMTLGTLMEDTQKEMLDIMKNTSLSEEEKFKQMAGILDGFVDKAIDKQDYANQLFEKFQQSAADKGFDIFNPESAEAAKEKLDSFISNMQSALTSLEVTAKDVSDNIYDYFRQAMINALYEKEYKSKMEELYKTFEDLSSDGLSESDMAQLNSQINEYIDQMMKGVEDVNSLFADKLKDNEDLQSFVDNVKSAMSSIEATAEDVTDNIFEYIRQQMVEKMFADTFQPQIEEFYKKVQEAMSDGDITDSERDALRTEAEKLANDIVAAKDILTDTLGITSKNLQKELEEEFKSFSDGILNSLYNAEVTAESVAKDIAESMRKELIEAMYIEQYEPRIKAIWEKWKEYSADGLVTDEERANIKNDIDELGKEVADAAKEISDAWTDSGEEVKKAFESFSDSIKNVLYDAEATAEDVANNIYQYMRNALVDSMFTAQLKPQIQAWYDKYTEFMADGAIDTAERKTLDEMIAEIQKAGVDIVDAANALFPSLDTGAIKRAEEAAQEAENARNEAEQEWESFSDDILNSLYDIEATAEDISDDMGEYMRKALIKAMYVNNFKPQMQKWYNEWQKAMGDDNLTSEEKQTLDAMKQTMVDDMKKEVDAINQFFGTMYSQQASSKGFEAMSQDTGEELNGRFTALQVAGEEIKNQAVQQTGLLSSINNKLSLLNLRSEDIPALRSGNFNIADRTREVIASGYQSQINVVFPTDDIRTLTDKVSNMERIVDELRTFQIEKFTDVVEGVTKISKNTPQMNDKLDRINENIKRAL